MSATVDWHPALLGVLLMKIQGNVTEAEVLAVSEQESALIVSANRVVDTIIDAHELGQVPPNFVMLMPRIANMPAARHPNAGVKVVVGVGGVGGALMNVFSRLYHKIYFFSVMSEAEQFIAQKRSANG